MIGTLATLVGAGLEALGGRRSIENPAVPLGDIDWDHPYASSVMGGTQASSGEVVNSQTALTVSAVLKALKLLSGDVAKLPLHVYERLPGGGKQRADKHPAYPLVRRQANDEVTALHVKRTLTAHAILTGRGNGYAYIFRKQSGDPTELLVLDPLVTYPVRENGRLLYVTTVNGEDRKLDASDVLHIRGLGFDGLVGYDILHLAKESIGGAMATKRYGNTYFKNSARPNVVLEHPGGGKPLSEPALLRLKKSWEDMHRGLENHHKTAILEEGLTAKVLTDNTRQSLLVEAQMTDILHISNVTGIPPHMLGHPARTSYNSLAEENQSYLDSALDDWLSIWEDECNAKLLTEEQKRRDSHFFEFVRAALVRADLETRTTAYNTALRGGWMNRDEIRERENLNPLPGGEGQKFFAPLELAVVGGEDGDAERAAEDLAFMRQVVLAYINDGTIGDVIFNLTEGTELLKLVNVPTYPEVAEPWLPIVAADGKLVSGETLEDSEGVTVGGDVVVGEPLDLGGGDDDGGSAEPQEPPDFTQVDTEDDDAVRTAYAAIVRTVRAQRQATLQAHRALIVDAVRRMHKRVCTQTTKAAKRPDGFLEFLDGLDAANRSVFIEAVGPAIRAVRSLSWSDAECDAQELASTYFTGIHQALLRAAECQPGALADAVGRWVAATETAAAESFADRVIRRTYTEQNHGT